MKNFTIIRYAFFVLLPVLVISSTLESIYAQTTSQAVTIATDRSSYIYGDRIIVFGTIKTVIPGNVLTVKIVDPYSDVIQTGLATFNQDGSYIYAAEISGSLWKIGGVYTIMIQYGTAVQNQATFTYTSTTAPINGIFQVQDPDTIQTFNISYAIFGGSIDKVSFDPKMPSLTVSVHSDNYGSVTLALPRKLLDAKTSDGSDVSFDVLVDGEKSVVQKEQSDQNNRTITIQFLQGDKNIQIIGTSTESGNHPNANVNENSTTNQQSAGQITNSSRSSTIPEFPFVLNIFVVSVLFMIFLRLKNHHKLFGI
ncbi:MAG: hypothetical protein KGH76_06040 [Thaumarchaeota archaeon]|nr:hypothetical protein [Nitrososphaerota archaeon]